MLFQDRNKESGYFLIGFLLNILMVEPDAFLEIETRPGLRAFRYVELPHELVEREDFLLGAWIPA